MNRGEARAPRSPSSQLNELEREIEALSRQIYRMAWRHEEIRRELRQAREETRRELGEVREEMHGRFFWVMLILMAGLFVIAILVVDFRLDVSRVLSA